MPVVGFLIGTSTPKGNFANLDERHKVIESVWHGYNASLTLAPAGRKVCWRRAYDAKHLAAHPQQRITELTFFLRVSGYDSGGGYVFKNPHHIFYNFAFSLKRRGNKRALDGDCLGEKTADCVVDCDGGGVTIDKLPSDGLSISLHNDGIAFGGDCDMTTGTWVRPGADDNVFHLDPAPEEARKTLEKK